MSVVAADVSTARKVAWLSSPDAWRDAPTDIRTIETNTSWVFIAGDNVRKLKKPNYEASFDVQTPVSRELNCRAAVDLNRRLAPDTYLGCYPLYLRDDGELCVFGPGLIVDWFVGMRRLDETRMLDRMIKTQAVRRGDIDALTAVFARFYAGRASVYMSADERLRRLRARFELDRAMLEHDGIDLPREEVSSICRAIDDILRAPPCWLSDRLRERRIVEGHGNLRLEHICLARPPVIIDCLEFDRSLRLVDPFEELAGLRMECERLDARWIGDRVIERCGVAMKDHVPVELLAFHAAMQACLRARLALRHLLQSPVRQPARWLPLAQSYIALARRSILELGALAVERRTGRTAAGDRRGHRRRKTDSISA